MLAGSLELMAFGAVVDHLRHVLPLLSPRQSELLLTLRQIKALKEIKILGEYYGLDLSRPATNAQEAVQWVYMACRPLLPESGASCYTMPL